MTDANDFPRDFSDEVLRTFSDLNADILVANILASQALKAVVRSSRWRDELLEGIREGAHRALEQAPLPDDPAYETMRRRTLARARTRLDAIFEEIA